MPYLAGLMSQYGLATQYYANTHPSIGQLLDADPPAKSSPTTTAKRPPACRSLRNNVVRELVAAGKTWKAYAESLPSVGYPGRGYPPAAGGQYYVRHVPIAYPH